MSSSQPKQKNTRNNIFSRDEIPAKMFWRIWPST